MRVKIIFVTVGNSALRVGSLSGRGVRYTLTRSCTDSGALQLGRTNKRPVLFTVDK